MRCSARFARELRRLLVGRVLASSATNAVIAAAALLIAFALPASADMGIVPVFALAALIAFFALAILSMIDVAQAVWIEDAIGRVGREFIRRHSGFVHYPRCPEPRWASDVRALMKIKAAVSTRDTTAIDLAWVPIFVIALFVLHPLLALLALFCCTAKIASPRLAGLVRHFMRRLDLRSRRRPVSRLHREVRRAGIAWQIILGSAATWLVLEGWTGPAATASGVVLLSRIVAICQRVEFEARSAGSVYRAASFLLGSSGASAFLALMIRPGHSARDDQKTKFNIWTAKSRIGSFPAPVKSPAGGQTANATNP